jgi:phenylalanyl-tRNA synthetase beta chain
MNLGPLEFRPSASKHLQTGQAASIALSDGQSLGTIGRLSDAISSTYKFRQPVYVAELDLNTLLDSADKAVQYRPLPRYPSVMRDVTLVVARSVTLADLLWEINSRQIADCRGAKLVGTYEGAGIPDDKRSITLRIEYRSSERTLRDEEIEERQRVLIDTLCRIFAAEQH